MAEVEEVQFTSLAGRIAALNQAQVGRTVNNGSEALVIKRQNSTPSSVANPETGRSHADRFKTANYPPVSKYGNLTKQNNNDLLEAKPKEFLPPPLIDRDLPKKSPQLTGQKKPPPLPHRKDSRTSPALPARNTSNQLVVRRGSNDSMLSYTSSISNLSIGHSGSSATSIDTSSSRKLPPPLDQENLPPLPPSRRELEEKAKMARQTKVPSISVQSPPTVPQTGPLSPALPPRLPSRPNKSQLDDDSTGGSLTHRLVGEAPPMPPRPRPNMNDRTPVSMLPPPVPYASRPNVGQISSSNIGSTEGRGRFANSALTWRD